MNPAKPYLFRNWGKNIRHHVKSFEKPATEEELIQLIKSHKNIRFTGAGHSWSPLCVTDGILISLDAYNKVIEIDKINKTIRVQAGIRIYELNKILDSCGLALENMGSIDQQSIIGAISTGTHGTGINFRILGNQLLAFKLIKADGSVITIDREKDPDLFYASVIGLGCLGCVSEVTLQAVPAFRLHDYTTTASFNDVIQNLEKYLQNADHFKIWWLPPSEEAVVFSYQRTEDKANDSRIRQYLKDEVLSVVVYRTLVRLGKYRKQWRKAFNRFLTFNMKGPLDRIEKSFGVFIVPEPPCHRETEWGFDVAQAREILAAYRKFITDHKLDLQFIQEIRFTKGDDFWISPCHQRDTMWIGLYAYPHEGWEEMRMLFEEFAKAHQGRPHWGKEFDAGKEYLMTQYPRYTEFEALRKSWDPEGKFENDFIRKYFG